MNGEEECLDCRVKIGNEVYDSKMFDKDKDCLELLIRNIKNFKDDDELILLKSELMSILRLFAWATHPQKLAPPHSY